MNTNLLITSGIKNNGTKNIAVTPANARPARLLSLDALRGFDMFWIICGEGIFHSMANAIVQRHALVRNPVDYQIAATSGLSIFEKATIGISNQLHHSPWNGFTFYDLIFPLFIFIAGVSMPFSLGNQLALAVDTKAAKKKIYGSLLKRTAILILLGMIVNGLLQWPGYANTRFASVLGRIGLACFFAAIIYINNNIYKQMAWFAGLLLAYWALLMWVPVPGFGAGNLTPEGSLPSYTDQILLPGKLHRKVYDPEGLLATIPAIATALLGVFTGTLLRNNTGRFTMLRKMYLLVTAGLLLLAAGWLWGRVFPINKTLWTSSFVLYTGGWSILLLAAFYTVIDVAGCKRWSMPFVWVGANSILIYMAAHGLVDFTATSGFVFGGLIHLFSPAWQPAVVWVGVAVIQFILLYFLFERKWFLKI